MENLSYAINKSEDEYTLILTLLLWILCLTISTPYYGRHSQTSYFPDVTALDIAILDIAVRRGVLAL